MLRWLLNLYNFLLCLCEIYKNKNTLDFYYITFTSWWLYSLESFIAFLFSFIFHIFSLFFHYSSIIFRVVSDCLISVFSSLNTRLLRFHSNFIVFVDFMLSFGNGIFFILCVFSWMKFKYLCLSYKFDWFSCSIPQILRIVVVKALIVFAQIICSYFNFNLNLTSTSLST